VPTHEQMANSVRMLAVDAVERAHSGHPGMPMGMADIATVLWQHFLKFNPLNPHWFDRDRFVLSNGHGSMLHYALLHLTGFNLSIEDLKNFRQLHSKTPGHPEVNETPGIETTTGPLGQGFANAVGMAMAESRLAAEFNRDHFPLVNHYTYVFVGDGCLMEGISHEAASLAGIFKLNKLIAFWDNNGISIDGKTKGWFTENIPERFRSYGWHVIAEVNGHHPEEIFEAISQAKTEKQKPTLICCKTHIGFGAPHLVDTEKSHGSPLGAEEIKGVREKLNWHYPPFEIPQEIYEAWDAREKGEDAECRWRVLFSQYERAYPELAKEYLRRVQNFLPLDWHEKSKKQLEKTLEDKNNLATRKASQKSLNMLAPDLPEFMGGSADLTGSNNTDWSGSRVFNAENRTGNYIHYGVREFGMSAIMNGMALHKGIIPYGGTFLVFSDYARNAVRMAALMKQKVIFVYSHDSIGLGEDGPTHQAIEQTASLRLIPHLHVWRPADFFETMAAWQSAVEYQGPTCLLLTRQNIAPQMHTQMHLEKVKRGAYILRESKSDAEIIFVATGSEVQLAVKAAEILEKENIFVRVVSMPCCEIFLKQDLAYQERILPSDIKKRIAIEAGVKNFWYQFVGKEGKIIGLIEFGLSAPAEKLFEYFGLTVEKMVEAGRELCR